MKAVNGSIDKDDSVLSMPGTLDFVQYAARYCALVEPWSTPEWTHSTLEELCVLLANIYAAGWRLPILQDKLFVELEHMVTEQAYNDVRKRVEQFLGENDRFLNAQMEDMKYSDVPVSVSTAEILADIYQSLGNFIWVIRQMNPDSMYSAFTEIRQSMMDSWGGLLLAALRQIHDLLGNPNYEC